MKTLEYGDNYLNDTELSQIWRELDSVSQSLLPPEQCGAEQDKKQGRGFFAEEFVASTLLPSIFSLKNKVKHDGKTTLLINYYENGGYYKPHVDDSVKTLTVFLSKEENSFTGGDFRFVNENLTIPFKNNSYVLFSGELKHEVTPVEMHGTAGRYSLNFFFY